jgi:heptaprenyl diphosphate synthase
VWESLPAIKTELDLLEREIRGQFGSKRNINSYLDRLSLDIIESGGKRLRPAMMIAAAMAGEYERDKVLSAAASVELLHTATLVHDDIIDSAPLRRGVPTVFASRGAKTAVFTGDYIYVKSILSLASSGLPAEYMQQVAKAVEAVCVGEVGQFEGRGKIPGFKTYLSRITRKTGALFAASCAIGAHLGKLPEEDVKRAARFGGYFGIAFQIMDDLLDIKKDPGATGKPSGNDLKEGTITLPVLAAAAEDKGLRALVESYLKSYNRRKKDRRAAKILSRVQSTGAVSETLTILNRYIDKAKDYLERLPDSPGRQMLGEILSLTFKDIRESES